MSFIVNEKFKHVLGKNIPYTSYTKFHQTIPGYNVTHIKKLGGNVYLKDESNRLRCNSFKILGASSAISSELYRITGETTKTFLDIVELLKNSPFIIYTATDGNFGVAVSHFCKMINAQCVVYIPWNTPIFYIELIRKNGGEICLIKGDYDDCVDCVLEKQGCKAIIPILDTSVNGELACCSNSVIDGYMTLFGELVQDFDYILIQSGVGGLAAAAIKYIRLYNKKSKVVTVEPDGFNCIQRSIMDGCIQKSSGSESKINGLKCNTPSNSAWEYLKNGVYASLTIDDATCERTYYKVKEMGIRTGITGICSYAAYMRYSDYFGDSKVLCINTECTEL